MSGASYSLEVQPNIPDSLSRLQDLANDLLYSWDRHVRNLFHWLDPDLWETCRHNPRVFLRRLGQERLVKAAVDPLYVKKYNSCLSAYDTYLAQRPIPELAKHLDLEQDLVAYFCAEFGLHESLPIYSGGLGILAGDYCKAASDMGLPFVGVGLLYRLGYFHQTIDGQGSQHAHYIETQFADIPVSPATDPTGKEVHIHVPIQNREVEVKVWQAKAGHITLYLLDSDLPGNRSEDRSITHQLYGGDNNTRIQQEAILGIGGVRALRAIQKRPTIWHINEGHAAFLILERCRELIVQGLDFYAALEAVAAATVFTTHTPVPAGHDIFDRELIHANLGAYIAQLGIAEEAFMELGASPENYGGFNQTALALHGSRFHNGVSRIHGEVASKTCGFAWPQIPHKENPMHYITNGVHVPSFLHREWSFHFDVHFDREWRDKMLAKKFWQGIQNIPDHAFWSAHQSIKTTLLEDVRRRITIQHCRNGAGTGEIRRLTAALTADALIVGFARRFATYKRATLLFHDLERLARIVNNPDRPVLFIFAGKAHPNDVPGQNLMREINEYSRQPEFEGKIILVEGYDMALARQLVSGVDVWLNTPEYPLEASGTSGQKAGINGVVNLSVLDGWWGEGYDAESGWAITPHGVNFDPGERDREESLELLDILEYEIIPMYYQRNGHGYSVDWLQKAKHSMINALPRFNAQRMVMDYIARFYGQASRQGASLAAEEFKNAKALSAWKHHVARAWPEVRLGRLDQPLREIKSGELLCIRMAAHLNGLKPDDVVVECLLGAQAENGDFVVESSHPLSAGGQSEAGETVFELDLNMNYCGLYHYKLRMYPSHRLLSHPFETGWMLWAEEREPQSPTRP